MKRRTFLKAATTSAVVGTAGLGAARTLKAAAAEDTKNERYKAEVPDTLDLAQRAGLVVNALTGSADLKHNYECFTCAHVDHNPPYMSHKSGGPCWPKQLHPLPMMRIMSGSTQNTGHDARMMASVVGVIEDNGLLWLRAEGRPWDSVYGGDTCCTGSQSRFVIALLDWHKYTRDHRAPAGRPSSRRVDS